MHETSSTWNDRLTHRPPSWGVPGARCCRKFVKIFKLDRSMTQPRPLKILTNFLQQRATRLFLVMMSPVPCPAVVPICLPAMAAAPTCEG